MNKATKTIAAQLVTLRQRAQLTQVQLAKRLCRSQSLVARAETGSFTAGADYIARVRKACKR
jgi:transcriptional regulator with XRE-family HTH domain